MSRPLRLEYQNALYHVTSRGDRRENIYENDEDREIFLSVLASVIKRFNWICHAYCLMDNHYHLLIQTPRANLSKGMRQLNGVYTQAYNRQYQISGHLFQGRYKAIHVDEEAYLLELSRYIVLNPVKANIVKQPEDWRWSSYLAMIESVKAPKWLAVDELLIQFNENRQKAIKSYQQFVREGIKNGPIWEHLKRQVYLGNEDFIEKLQEHIKGNKKNIQVPKIQKRAKALGLKEYKKNNKERNTAIYKAYSSGAYSYKEIGDYFGLHFVTIGKIVRALEDK
jgi:REP element-mobilizing transposase RayT